MIEIIQAGQPGKEKSLIEMHRVRKLIFRDRMQWDVDITEDGLEIDDYDLPGTVYILVRDDQSRVVGVWRLTPTDGPSMIRDIWPEFLNSFPLPVSPDIWELSRFGVHSYEGNTRDNIRHVNVITARLITALIETCRLTDIPFVYSMYNKAVERSVARIGFLPDQVSKEVLVDGKSSFACRVPMDQVTLERVQSMTGISCGITEEDLPPILQDRIDRIGETRRKVAAYG